MSTGNALIKDVTIKMMASDFLLWRCLHGGPLTKDNVSLRHPRLHGYDNLCWLPDGGDKGCAFNLNVPDWFKSKDVYRNVLQAPRNRIILFGLTACI